MKPLFTFVWNRSAQECDYAKTSSTCFTYGLHYSIFLFFLEVTIGENKTVPPYVISFPFTRSSHYPLASVMQFRAGNFRYNGGGVE